MTASNAATAAKGLSKIYGIIKQNTELFDHNLRFGEQNYAEEVASWEWSH